LEIKQFFSVIFAALDTRIGRPLKTARTTAKLTPVLAARRYPRKPSIFQRNRRPFEEYLNLKIRLELLLTYLGILKLKPLSLKS
jgi:hypothetical protein